MMNPTAICGMFLPILVRLTTLIMCSNVLLFPLAILQVCSATEYYIKPTEPTDTDCPGQPCLTLNEYTNNTDFYIRSNTVFTFLPGKHHMNGPLKVTYMQNITLKSTSTANVRPLLVPKFPCEVHDQCHEIPSPYVFRVKQKFDINELQLSLCCSVLHLLGVTVAHIDGIQIAANYMSGLIIEQCMDVHINNTALTHMSSRMNASDHKFGLLVFNSSRIAVESLRANRFSWGIAAYKSDSISISNTVIQNCTRTGVLIFRSDRVSVVNVLSQKNGYGLVSASTNHIIVANSTLMNNSQNGITLIRTNHSDIHHSFSDYNGIDGLFFTDATNTTMNRIHATHNARDGLRTRNSKGDIHSFSDYNRLFFTDATNTPMNRIHATHNARDRQRTRPSTNLTMINIIVKHCKNYAINIVGGPDIVTMENVYASNNSGGIFINYVYLYMKNISTEYNQGNGVRIIESNMNTTMLFVSSNYNSRNGIDLNLAGHTLLLNSSCTGNHENGIFLKSVSYIRITNLSSKYNHNHGMVDLASGNTILTDSNFVHNKYGDITLNKCTDFSIIRTAAFVTAIMSKDIHFGETIFSEMSLSISTSADTTSLPGIVTLYKSTAKVYNCSFTNNTISAIRAIESDVTFSDRLTFSHNRALSGTALVLVGNSTLILTENCKCFFIGNSASDVGAVIHINTEESYMRSMTRNDLRLHSRFGSLTTSFTRCFIHVRGSRSDTRLVFVNNTAEKGGDVLYGGLVALGYDGDWNCLLSFKNISDMSQQSGLSTITSDPSRVCFCKDGEPDCLTVADPLTRHIYPGQTITIPAVVVGQDLGTVPGSVYAKFVNTSAVIELDVGQNITNVDQNQCSIVEYTIFTRNEKSEAIMVLTANNMDVLFTFDEGDNQEMHKMWKILNNEPNYNVLLSKEYNESLTLGHHTTENFYKFLPGRKNEIDGKFVFPKEIYSYPIYSTIGLLPCPAGFTLTTEKPFKCDCNYQLRNLPTVECHIQDQTISRSGLIWVGSDGNKMVVTSQQCPLDYCQQEVIKVTLDNVDSQCNHNHSGTLCGGCQAGLSLVLGSNRCQQCSNSYIGLLIAFTLSGIVLVFFIKVMDLTVSQGTLNGFIFYANVVKINEHLLFLEKNAPLTIFISWLNLDLGIETCFYDGLSAYSKVWLQFVFPLYIWSIAGLIIVLSKYSDRVAKVMGNNSVPVLATLILLSYAKLMHTIILVLSFSMLTNMDSSKAVWSADGHLDYLGLKHAPLFFAAVATLFFLWLPYTIVLFFGQWLYRCKSQLVTRMLIKFKPFLDVHYGPMKSNHRYWYGALLLMRVAILLLSALLPANYANVVVFCITVCSILLVNFALRVYNSNVVGVFVASLYTNLGILTASHTFTALEGYEFLLPPNVLIGLAFTQFTGLVLIKICVIFNIREKIRQWIRVRKDKGGDDDWELNEEAALVQEREAEMEREADLGGIALKEINNGPANL